MTTNHGLYTDCAWAVPVLFKDEGGNPIDLSGHNYVAEAIASGEVRFQFKSIGAGPTDGTIDVTNADAGTLVFGATAVQHVGVSAGRYRIHLKRLSDTWTSEGTLLIGEPGEIETYLRFDESTFSEVGGSISYAQMAALSATAAAQSAVDAAQSAVDAAQSAVDAAVQVGLATDQVALAAAQVLLGQAQVALGEAARVGAETARTGAETARTGAEAAQALAQAAVTAASDAGAAQVALAANQAILAAGYASAAASVVQQDLSGVTAAALHRSPNAVTALAVVDTSKDSDGGAWTEKCQHTSWWNETLNGKWLGAQATEAAARAVSGAVTGDYFQRTSDGKFYSLNSGSGITEVFRGNKRDFPRLAALVSDATGLTIYDLTEVGRPMWMRFPANTTNNYAAKFMMFSVGNGLVMSNGLLASGGNASWQDGLTLVDFVRDNARRVASSFEEPYASQISGRATAGGYAGVNQGSISIATAAVNSIAMAVMPEAPINPATGLRIPTIAVGTSGGVSVIKPDGTVTTVGTGGTALGGPKMVFDGRYLVTGRYASNGPTFVKLGLNMLGVLPGGGNNNANVYDAKTLSAWTGVTYGNWPLSNGSSPTSVGLRILDGLKATLAMSAGLNAGIAALFNTGWLPGDIRRAFMSDTVAGSLNAPELVSNGDFASGATGWTNGSTGTGTSAFTGGVATIVGTDGSNRGGFSQNVGLLNGKAYRATFTATINSGAASVTNVSVGQGGQAIVAGSNTYNFIAGSTPSIVFYTGSGGGNVTIDNVSVRESVADRSYKASGALAEGTLTRAVLTSGTSLMGFSGWSAANYLREPYSSDLDFGTGEWSVSAWASVPASPPAANFPAVGPELVANGTFDSDTSGWASASGAALSATGGRLRAASGGSPGYARLDVGGLTPGKAYVLSGDLFSGTVAPIMYAGTAAGGLQYGSRTSSGTITFVATQATLYISLWANSASAGVYAEYDNISLKEAGPAIIVDRAFSSGARLRLGVNALGYLVAEAYDGTTSRTVTSAVAYNTAQWLKAEACYTTDGGLSIRVNGREVAATRGSKLLTLNNSSAVLTIGNSYALDAPFPGSLALVKLGATVPTADQSAFMYEQEKELFRAGAVSVLPDSGTIVDLTYDDATDRWIAATAANESYWTGLVRNASVAVPAGSFSKLAAASGVELAARITTTPGVDITMPSYNLREELLRRGAEAAAQRIRDSAMLDFVGGFTGNTTNGSTAIASVAGLTYPTSYIGARISGSGIPANTTIVGVSGSTIYISAAATATATGVSITFLDFILPTGLEARSVLAAGAAKQEGATKDFTRIFDGMAETIRFGAAPGVTAWVQIQAQRMAA